MESPSEGEVRRALATLDGRDQKIVAGLLGVMMQNASRVRDREWMARQITEMTVLAGGFEAGSAREGVLLIEEFLSANAARLLQSALLLFQRVGLDLAPRAAQGFTFEEALRCALGYLPSIDAGSGQASGETTPGSDALACGSRELGEQPIARLMDERGLKPRDLVAASEEQLTHKMVTRAMKGRRLTANTMAKVQRAWNRATGYESVRGELFDYEP